MDGYARRQEWAGFTEYMMYVQDGRRLIRVNFLAGLMRGLGFAVGFSLLGAVMIVLVRQLALDNLPGIGVFFAEVVKIVQSNLH